MQGRSYSYSYCVVGIITSSYWPRIPAAAVDRAAGPGPCYLLCTSMLMMTLHIPLPQHHHYINKPRITYMLLIGHHHCLLLWLL